MMGDNIFILTYNTKQLGDDYDATFQLIMPNPAPIDNAVLRKMSENAQYIEYLPIFYSYFDPFDAIDYPDNHQALKILSKKALDIVLDNFPKNGLKYSRILALDSLISDDDDPRLNLENTTDIIKESIKDKRYYNDEYYIVDLPVLDNVFDMENSEYKNSRAGGIGWVDKYVFKERSLDCPLFTIPESLGVVFITEELRSLWRRAGVFGTSYLRLDAPYNSHETDIEAPSQGASNMMN